MMTHDEAERLRDYWNAMEAENQRLKRELESAVPLAKAIETTIKLRELARFAYFDGMEDGYLEHPSEHHWDHSETKRRLAAMKGGDQ